MERLEGERGVRIAREAEVSVGPVQRSAAQRSRLVIGGWSRLVNQCNATVKSF